MRRRQLRRRFLLHHPEDGRVHHAAGADHRRAVDALFGQHAAETVTRGEVTHGTDSPARAWVSATMLASGVALASPQAGETTCTPSGRQPCAEAGDLPRLALVQQEGADIAHHRQLRMRTAERMHRDRRVGDEAVAAQGIELLFDPLDAAAHMQQHARAGLPDRLDQAVQMRQHGLLEQLRSDQGRGRGVLDG